MMVQWRRILVPVALVAALAAGLGWRAVAQSQSPTVAEWERPEIFGIGKEPARATCCAYVTMAAEARAAMGRSVY